MSLTPFAVIVAFVTLVAFKRELDTVMFLLGQLTNEMLNMLLKNTIREQRPTNGMGATDRSQTYGMPSNHSQFQSFFTTFSLLFVMVRMKHKSFGFRFLLMAGLTSSCAAVIYSRFVFLFMYTSVLICFHFQDLLVVPYLASGFSRSGGRSFVCVSLFLLLVPHIRTSALQRDSVPVS